MQQPAQFAPGAVPANHTRYGCFPLRVGVLYPHRLRRPLTLPKEGRLLAAGQVVHLGVEDITRHPDVGDKAVWVCSHPSCQGKHWESKRDLLAGHPEERLLKKLMEIHCYHAVAELPAVEARPAVVDKKTGEITADAVQGQPARVVLLSDEE